MMMQVNISFDICSTSASEKGKNQVGHFKKVIFGTKVEVRCPFFCDLFLFHF
jgi:hypothetical protein